METAGPGGAVRGVLPAYRTPHPWGAAVPGNKEKEAKRKIRKGTPVETAAAVEITEDAARLLFRDFHRCLEKPAGFSTVTTGPAAMYQIVTLKGDTSIEVNRVTFLKWLDNPISFPPISR